jgi:YEATS family
MLHIAQNQVYQGNDWWRWSVWVEGPAAELDVVDSVTWRLHPTFVPSAVQRNNRAEGFRLDTGGWGTFLLSAKLHLRGGRTQLLKHELELFYPDEASAPTKGSPDVEAFVHAQALPTPNIPSSGALVPESRGAGIAAPLFVVGRHLVTFGDTIPAPIRPLLCQGLLLADLAANTRSRDDAAAWFTAYVEVLQNLGWSITRREATTSPRPELRHGELRQALIPMLTTSLKPRSDSKRILEVLTAIDEADRDAPWFVMLDRSARGGRVAGLIFTAMDGDGTGGANLTSVFVALDAASQSVKPLLLTPVGPAVWQSATVDASIGAGTLAATRDALAAKLAPFLDDNIKAVDR